MTETRVLTIILDDLVIYHGKVERGQVLFDGKARPTMATDFFHFVTPRDPRGRHRKWSDQEQKEQKAADFQRRYYGDPAFREARLAKQRENYRKCKQRDDEQPLTDR